MLDNVTIHYNTNQSSYKLIMLCPSIAVKVENVKIESRILKAYLTFDQAR